MYGVLISGSHIREFCLVALWQQGQGMKVNVLALDQKPRRLWLREHSRFCHVISRLGVENRSVADAQLCAHPWPLAWFQHLTLRQNASRVSLPLTRAINPVQDAHSIVSSICPGSLVHGSICEVVGACAATLATEEPPFVAVTVRVRLHALAIFLVEFPLAGVGQPLSVHILSLSVLLVVSPLANVITAVGPILMTLTMELVTLELANVLQASVDAVERAFSVPLVEAELALVISVRAFDLLMTKAEPLPTHIRHNRGGEKTHRGHGS
mmetsp:Transcript_9911/g.27658  ORF Transcript_9911/g.27658 Transcript_9911/m.27658 type:complete len:268 (+) Transcript_9911:438-1241(+)